MGVCEDVGELGGRWGGLCTSSDLEVQEWKGLAEVPVRRGVDGAEPRGQERGKEAVRERTHLPEVEWGVLPVLHVVLGISEQ